MARGNRGNGSRGGFRGGRGGGRGRGGGGGRGRGRGDSMDNTDFSIYDWANNAPRGGSSNSGFNTPRGRGKGRGSGYNTPQRGNSTPQRGFQTPRGRGRPQYTPLDAYDDVGGMGRGRGSPTDNRARGRGGKNLASKLRAGAPLSKLLYEDRPLLRPIAFVRSVHTATLFEEKEDLLQPLSEEVTNDEQSHVPTADRVTQVFSGTAEDGESSDEEEQLEEIDFTEIGRIQAEVDAAAADKTQVAAQVEVIEEKFTGFFVDTQPGPVNHTATETEGSREVLGDDDEEIIVYVAPHPRAGPVTPPAEEADPMAESMEVPSSSILTGRPLEEVVSETVELRASHAALQSELPPEATASVAEGSTEAEIQGAAATEKTEEISSARMDIVETEGPVAEVEAESSQRVEAVTSDQPLQAETTEAQNGRASTPPALAEVSFAFKSTTTTTKLARRFHPTRTPRSLIKKNKVRRKSLRGSFGLFGAQLEEAHLRERDPREHERRIGDSDLDWGDGDSDTKDAVEELSTGVGDMQIDDDLDVSAMASFVKSMSAEGSRQVTMDDVADIQRMREEDEEDEDEDDEDGTSSEEDVELEQIIRHEEETMIAEDAPEDSDDDDLSSSDEEGTPGRSFQRRLERIRKNAEGKRPAKATDPQDNLEDDDDDDDDDFEMELEQSWAEDDEDFIAHMQNIIDQNEVLLTGKDRKSRNKLFRSIQNGDWDIDDYEELMGIHTPKRKKSKPQGITPELEAQWQKDRDKKAENKRKRALARLEAAADPLTPKKGGKKGMKAMLAAARYDGPEELPNRVVDLVSLEQQIRRFLRDIGGPNSMSLPPASKDTRKKIHELAEAFSLKSQSKGSGDRRYTTLTKTTKSGLNVNEKKVRRIMRGVAGYQWEGPGKGSGRSKTMSLAKHNEGEEVGKAAPKIGDTNIGFKMLASMGWAEGDRIGLSGGLDAPLTAKMKKTKLGLGATL